MERLSFVYEDDNGKAAKRTLSAFVMSCRNFLSHSHDLHKRDLNRLIEWLDEHIDFTMFRNSNF